MFPPLAYLQWIEGRPEAAEHDLGTSDLRRLPDGDPDDPVPPRLRGLSEPETDRSLRERVAAEYGLDEANVLLTAGATHGGFSRPRPPPRSPASATMATRPTAAEPRRTVPVRARSSRNRATSRWSRRRAGSAVASRASVDPARNTGSSRTASRPPPPTCRGRSRTSR
ncbi:hypothetical protein ACFQFD_07755 [Halobaculum halobium]|uniref:Uncharacterized protein n=1 Tax=Halobaculum halobium TaxID=3032281 RepID=A0ABD5TBD1_9EURY